MFLDQIKTQQMKLSILLQKYFLNRTPIIKKYPALDDLSGFLGQWMKHDIYKLCGTSDVAE